MSSQQDQAINCANAYFTAIQQISGLRDAIRELNNSYSQLNMAAIFAAMPTAAQHADGSLGTADTTPNANNPIDNRVVTRLALAISSYDIGVMEALGGALDSLLNGVTVATQQYAPSVLAKTKTT